MLDFKFFLLFFSFIITPLLIGFVEFLLLGRIMGEKGKIVISIFLSVCIVFSSAFYPYFFIAQEEDLGVQHVLLGATFTSIIMITLLLKRISYSWINDPVIFEELCNPKKISRKLKCNKNIRVLICAIISLYSYRFAQLLLALFWGGVLGDFNVSTISVTIVAFAPLLFAFWGILVHLVRCENCNLSFFIYDQREFIHTAKNVLFNKYFVCVHCNARFSMKEGVDLDKLPNNYQRDYETDPVRPYIHAYDKPDDAKSE